MCLLCLVMPNIFDRFRLTGFSNIKKYIKVGGRLGGMIRYTGIYYRFKVCTPSYKRKKTVIWN